MRLSAELRRLVVERAQNCCEFCLLHQDDTPFAHHLDHVVAQKHGGDSVSENLALACLDCNWHKGTDLTAIDPFDGMITPLFHPRRQNWNDHFLLAGAHIVGQTSTGRATSALLRLNDPARVLQRQVLIDQGRYPSAERSVT